MVRRVILSLSLALLVAVLAACGTTTTPGDKTVTRVVVTPAQTTIKVGSANQMAASVEGSAGVSQAVAWTSDDPDIATVTTGGLVTGAGVGTTQIRAASLADPNKVGTAAVTVTALSCPATEVLDHVTVPTTLTGTFGCVDFVVNQYEVNVTAPLTIAPGVTIAFQQGARLDVEAGGSIIANGAAAQPVTFTGQNATAGFWTGIRFYSAIPSTLQHTVVEYGGGATGSTSGNLYVANAGVLRLQNSVVRHSKTHGLNVASGGNLEGFSENVIRDNATPVRLYARHLPQLDSATDFATGNVDNVIDVFGGDTDADAVWPATNAPSRVAAYEVNVKHAITVADGADFMFQGGSRLDIEAGGSINATAAGKGITFRGASDTPGFWTGVRVYSSVPSTFDGVTFANGGGESAASSATVRIFSGGKAGFRNSTFANSSNYGLTAESAGDLTGFGANTFSGNRVPMRVSARHLVQLDGTDAFPAGNTEPFIDVAGGSTDVAGSWMGAAVPYRVIASELDVKSPITVHSDVEFRFQGGSRLDVEAGGSLSTASGATGIVFTGTTAVAGHWMGIRLFTAGAVSFDSVTVSYGGGGTGSTAANIYASGGNLSLQDTTVSHSKNYGLYVTGSVNVTPDNASDMLMNNLFSANAGGDISGL